MTAAHDPAELVARVREGEPDAFDALVEAGEAALPPLVAALEDGGGSFPLTAALAMMQLADPVAVLGPLASHPSILVSDAALTALAASRAPGALTVLAASDHRFGSVVALGDLGDPAAIPILRDRVTPWLGDDLQQLPAVDLRSRARRGDLVYILEVASALAKLGDHSLAAVTFHLAGPPHDAEIRAAAVTALHHVTAAGVANALHQLSRDPDEQVAIAALLAMLYLGRIDEVDAWIAALAAGGRVGATARYCLEAFAGEHPTGAPGTAVSPTDAAAWWTRARAQFRPGVCYRLGELAHPGQLVALLPRDPWRLRTELRVHTSLPICDFVGTFPVTPGEHARLAAWWRDSAMRFPPGRLHRWGRAFDAGAVD
jgi:hypothetical protein